MIKLSLPPLTRIILLVLVFCSIAVFTLRYMEYSIQYEQAVEFENYQKEKPEDEREVGVWPLFRDITVPFVTLIPVTVVKFPWTLLTTVFVEKSVISLLISGACLGLAGRYLERVWGLKSLGIFYLMLTVIPNLITLFCLVFLFSITTNEWWLQNPICGSTAIQAGFLVAFKQLVPEHSIVLFQGAIRVHVKHLIMPILISYATLGIIIKSPVMTILPWVGFLTAWIWLRFYRVMYIDSLLPMSDSLTAAADTQTKIKGDASDTFAFADFFYPQPVKQIVETFSNTIFDALCVLRICTPFNTEEVEASNQRASMRTGSVSENSDADRRRALALKVLEERLQT